MLIMAGRKLSSTATCRLFYPAGTTILVFGNDCAAAEVENSTAAKSKLTRFFIFSSYLALQRQFFSLPSSKMQ